MKRLAMFSVLALPSLAHAHDGHSHFGSPITHHLLEGLVVAAFAVAAAWTIRAWRKNVNNVEES